MTYYSTFVSICHIQLSEPWQKPCMCWCRLTSEPPSRKLLRCLCALRTNTSTIFLQASFYCLNIVIERELNGRGAQAHFIGLSAFQVNIMFEYVRCEDIAF